jgi:sulfonate transport system substrate-binding protein
MRRFTLVFAVVLLAAFFAACGGDDSGSSSSSTDPATDDSAATASDFDLSEVSITIGDQLSFLKTLLESSGEIDGVPYEIEWTSFTSGPPLIEAINADAVDVGVVGDTPTIFAQAAGTPVSLIAAARSNDSAGSAIVVPDGSDIGDIADLEGKKVAFTRGSAAHAFIVRALADADLTLDDVEVIDLQPTDALAAFGTGEIDAWAIWDPFTALVEENNDASILVDGDEYTPGLTYMVARPAALDDAGKNAALADFVERVARAGVWRDSHLDEWSTKYAELTNLPPEIVTIVVERGTAEWVPIDDAVIADQQGTADVFFEAGEIPAELDVAETFDDAFNDAIAAVQG